MSLTAMLTTESRLGLSVTGPIASCVCRRTSVLDCVHGLRCRAYDGRQESPDRRQHGALQPCRPKTAAAGGKLSSTTTLGLRSDGQASCGPGHKVHTITTSRPLDQSLRRGVKSFTNTMQR